MSTWRIGHSSLDKGYSSGTVEIRLKRKLAELNYRLDVVCDRNGRARELLKEF